MIMADIFMYLFLVLGGLIIANCYFLLAEAVFSRKVRRARDLYARRPIRVTLIGAAVGVPLTLLGIAAASNGAGGVVGIPILSILVIGGLMGLTGLTRLIGEGLQSERDQREPWRAVLRGGIVLSIACLLPLAGWFVVFPVALASGFGVLIHVMMPVRNRQPQVTPVQGAQA